MSSCCSLPQLQLSFCCCRSLSLSLALSLSLSLFLSLARAEVAEALDMDPSIAGNIHGIYMMGSAYGVPGTNNVYDWQMTYNGVKGSCTEDGGQTYTGLSPPLNRSGVVSAIRPECRGVDMTAHGDTEWNVFMDVRAWHMVYGFLKDLPADHVYVLAANATLNMPVTLEEMEEYAARRCKYFFHGQEHAS